MIMSFIQGRDTMLISILVEFMILGNLVVSLYRRYIPSSAPLDLFKGWRRTVRILSIYEILIQK